MVKGYRAVLVHDCVIAVIEELIGIYGRLDDARAKPELARAIGAVIAGAVALDARSVHAHAQIVKFQKESAYLQSGGNISQKIMTQLSLRQRSPDE